MALLGKNIKCTNSHTLSEMMYHMWLYFCCPTEVLSLSTYFHKSATGETPVRLPWHSLHQLPFCQGHENTMASITFLQTHTHFAEYPYTLPLSHVLPSWSIQHHCTVCIMQVNMIFAVNNCLFKRQGRHLIPSRCFITLISSICPINNLLFNYSKLDWKHFTAHYSFMRAFPVQWDVTA